MLLLHCFMLFLSCTGRHTSLPNTEVISYRLGATPVELHRTRFEGAAPLSVVHLHDNEVTARTAAETVLEESGGSFLTLKNSGNRLLSYNVNKKKYLADPNRIFSLPGRRSTLQLLSRYNYGAALQLLRFANFFVQQIEGAGTIVGVHNNTDGKYSVLSYARGGTHSKDAREAYISDGRDPDDFYITTDDSVFQQLKAKDFNVVLQHNTRVADDGSLSVYYGRKGLSYINVEAEHGHLQEQILMLHELRDLLD